uniref:EF-hand domain-containing protein n=1 Tax=Aegilops tauschii subsp. strangulata TaxID=200361 RepID=A0A453SS37_AEGTS
SNQSSGPPCLSRSSSYFVLANAMATPARRASAQPQPLTVDFEALSYISRLVEAFQAFDSDSDGLVTAPELRGLLASLGLDKSEAEARDMLARADADRDGRLCVVHLSWLLNCSCHLGSSVRCHFRRDERRRARPGRARRAAAGRRPGAGVLRGPRRARHGAGAHGHRQRRGLRGDHRVHGRGRGRRRRHQRRGVQAHG